MFRTSPEIAAADRAAHGRTLDAVSSDAVRESAVAAWMKKYALSCGHAPTDGFREDDRGHVRCGKLTCNGWIVERR